VFVETIVLPRRDWERWHDRLRLLDDPPEALIASIAWDSGDGEVTGVNVWETPGAIADFFMERVRPFVEAEAEPPQQAPTTWRADRVLPSPLVPGPEWPRGNAGRQM
jgi:hypothetical protein